MPTVDSRLLNMTQTQLSQIMLDRIVDALRQNIYEPVAYTTTTLFIPELFPLRTSFPDIFKYPLIKEYEGNTCLINHLYAYTDCINLQVASDPVICKPFSLTIIQLQQGPDRSLIVSVDHFNVKRLKILELYIIATVSVLTHTIWAKHSRCLCLKPHPTQ
ncbi:Uncharacterized protein Adt_18068 [Abeliophyllum distichum]|uniref:Uncharacterized protein n=1 Tax=Abeliophyllum distichum TaxID=126358 RepID=A0ABD1TIL7_9LAMI